MFITCKSCGARISSDTKFCPSCGTKYSNKDDKFQELKKTNSGKITDYNSKTIELVDIGPLPAEFPDVDDKLIDAPKDVEKPKPKEKITCISRVGDEAETQRYSYEESLKNHYNKNVEVPNNNVPLSVAKNANSAMNISITLEAVALALQIIPNFMLRAPTVEIQVISSILSVIIFAFIIFTWGYSVKTQNKVIDVLNKANEHLACISVKKIKKSYVWWGIFSAFCVIIGIITFFFIIPTMFTNPSHEQIKAIFICSSIFVILAVLVKLVLHIYWLTKWSKIKSLVDRIYRTALITQ